MTDHLKLDGKRGVIDWPATAAQAATAVEQTAMPMLHSGRPFEAIGETIRRRVDRLPEPFPPKFAARLAATMLDEPEFGGVLRAVLGGTR
jgi:hypothetical protein